MTAVHLGLDSFENLLAVSQFIGSQIINQLYILSKTVVRTRVTSYCNRHF